MAVNLPNFIEDREEANSFLRFAFWKISCKFSTFNTNLLAAQNDVLVAVGIVNRAHQNRRESLSSGIT